MNCPSGILILRQNFEETGTFIVIVNQQSTRCCFNAYLLVNLIIVLKIILSLLQMLCGILSGFYFERVVATFCCLRFVSEGRFLSVYYADF